MAGVKKRTVNFTSDEKKILTELVLKYKDIVENKRTDATTNSDKLKGWMRIADQFNNISSHCNRTHATLKCCWENIKRQTKKDRAEVKKKIFMTGGGKPPTPPHEESSSVVGAILGPALEGNNNIFDSDAISSDYLINMEDKAEAGTSSGTAELSTKNKKKSGDETFSEDPLHIQSASSDMTEAQNWTSWTPQNLKTPKSEALKASKNNEDWLKRRRPKYDTNSSDIYWQEKIELVQILKENAKKESQIRLAMLEEQLKQEKIKTEKLESE